MVIFSEAEYTFRQRRDIVPLRVEPRYNPDGWLGALVGNRLFFDFSQEQFFEHSIINAIREIGQRGKKIANQEGKHLMLQWRHNGVLLLYVRLLPFRWNVSTFRWLAYLGEKCGDIHA